MKAMFWILLGLLIAALCFVAWAFWYYGPPVEHG
jgi:hypothetical protein